MLSAESRLGDIYVQHPEINAEVLEDIHLDSIPESIGTRTECAVLQPVYRHLPHRWIYNPVFPDACIRVKVQLADIVVAGIAGGDNLYDLVRRAAAASVRELARIADHADVRLYDGVPAAGQLHRKRGGIDPAGTAL